MQNIAKQLLRETKGSKVALSEPMSIHTSFRTGGKADLYIEADENELSEIVCILEETNTSITLVGNGSNLLVGDKGIRGAVLRIRNDFSGPKIDGETVSVSAGELLSTLAKTVSKEGLSGLEFASGIPGSVGGAVAMNAGAYDGQMADCISEVRCFNIATKETVVFKNPECAFAYRHSIFIDSDYIITRGKLNLKKEDPKTILLRIKDLDTKRKEKQPLDYPSAGSTFKRPEGYFAGKLIEECGLGGFQIGGAAVSKKHAGFIINKSNATSNDIKMLIEEVQSRVFEKFGVKLEKEVRFVGEFL